MQGLVEGVTGKPYPQLADCLLLPDRARKFHLLAKAGFSYTPSQSTHFFTHPNGSTFLQGQALLIAQNERLS